MKTTISLVLWMSLYAGTAVASDQAAAFFGERKVHEVRLYFDNPNWYNVLYQSHQSNSADPYFPARFVYGDLVLDPSGVRFKGNSSFRANGVKKGFKFDFNEFQEGTDQKPFSFFGMTKLSLNNGFSDPTLLREALFLDFIGRYIPAIRATFVRLYVNDKCFGLYSTVEMIDMNFIRSRFGQDEDGNLFEGERSDAVGGGVFGSNLAYLGPNPQSYAVTGIQRTVYGLLQFVRERYKYLRPRLDSYAEPSDVQLNELMALNAATVADNAGDYDPWVELHNLGAGSVNLAGFFLTDDAAQPAKWALPARKLADGEWLILWLDGETAEGDNHAGFRLNPGGGTLYLYFNGGSGPKLIDSVSYPGLGSGKSLIRIGNLNSKWLVSYETTAGGANPAVGINPAADGAVLLISEFMANNKSTIEDPDQPGAFEDWIEIHNPGAAAVDMSGMYLTDNLANPTKWKVPQGVTVPPKGYLVFWADNDPGQGPLHTNFKLAADGEEIGLYSTDGKTPIDWIVFEAQIEGPIQLGSTFEAHGIRFSVRRLRRGSLYECEIRTEGGEGGMSGNR